MRADLHKSLIYLDREYIADRFEVATGQSPDTMITKNQGKKAGAVIPVFSAEVSAQETRSFKVSTLGMLAHTWRALAAEPELDSTKFAPKMISKYGWFSGELNVYQASSVHRSGGTNEVLAESLSDRAVREHYRSLAQECPEYAIMHELVCRLCKKEYSAFVAAGTSHDILILETKNTAISVERWSNTQQYRVRLWPVRGKCETHLCHSNNEAERLVDALVLRAWLSNEQI